MISFIFFKINCLQTEFKKNKHTVKNHENLLLHVQIIYVIIHNL